MPEPIKIPVFFDVEKRSDLIDHDPARMEAILQICRRAYSRMGLYFGDWVTLPWLMRNKTPYKDDIVAIAEKLQTQGVYALNASFEWGCTTSVASQQMSRVLDWPLRLGDKVIVAHYKTENGPYYDINWLGYVGVLNGVAPGRFAATINQAPMTYNFLPRGVGLVGDWFFNCLRVRKNTDWLPSHLLRWVFENCPDYQTARARLMSEKLCAPAIFSLVGAAPDEMCIIERKESDAVVHDGQDSVTNHWINNRFCGRPRPVRSHDRREIMRSKSGNLMDWQWLQWPIFNKHSALIYAVDFNNNILKVQGLDGKTKTPSTEILQLSLRI